MIVKNGKIIAIGPVEHDDTLSGTGIALSGGRLGLAKDYATKDWVKDQHYLTSASVDITREWVEENYYNKVDIDNTVSGISAWASDTFALSANTYTKEEVDKMIADFGGFEIVDGTEAGPDLPVEDASINIIYLVKISEGKPDNYAEWIVTDTTGSKTWTCIGETSIDLGDYAKTEYVDEKDNALSGAIDNVIDAVAEEFNNTSAWAEDVFTTKDELNEKVDTLSGAIDGTVKYVKDEFENTSAWAEDTFAKQVDTYTKEEVDEKLSNLGGFEIVPGDEHGPFQPATEAKPNIIYLVEESGQYKDNYSEWIVTDSAGTKVWTCIGETTLELSAYATKTYVDDVASGIIDTMAEEFTDTSDWVNDTFVSKEEAEDWDITEYSGTDGIKVEDHVISISADTVLSAGQGINIDTESATNTTIISLTPNQLELVGTSGIFIKPYPKENPGYLYVGISGGINDSYTKEEIDEFNTYLSGAIDYVSANGGKTYIAGDNIDISNDYVISGRDWTDDISEASAYAYEQAISGIPVYTGEDGIAVDPDTHVISYTGTTGVDLSAGTDLVIDNGIVKVNTDGSVANSTEMSFVAGSATSASGLGAVAIGLSAVAAGQAAHAEGYNTSAFGNYVHAEGDETFAVAWGSHAEGYLTSALGPETHAEGKQTLAVSPAAHAEGISAVATAPAAHAEGQSTSALNQFTHAEGLSTFATMNGAHAEGCYTSAVGNYAHAEGGTTIAAAYNAHAEGDHTSALAQNAHAEGQWTEANGQVTHAEGVGTSAKALGAHSEGYNTIASGDFSHTEGYETQTYSSGAHAEGAGTHASGMMSHAEGIGTTAAGNNSHAEGGNTSAVGSQSHAEGSYTSAIGDQSHTEGYSALASGYQSHAEGLYTSAIGHQSHAEGNYTLASGYYAHAEGWSSSAIGQSTHAQGQYTLASGSNAFAAGKYNTVENASALFVIGNGTDINYRSDAFIVSNNGNASATTLSTSGIQDIETAINSKIDSGTTASWDIQDYSGASGIKVDGHVISLSAEQSEVYGKDGISIEKTGNDVYIGVSAGYYVETSALNDIVDDLSATISADYVMTAVTGNWDVTPYTPGNGIVINNHVIELTGGSNLNLSAGTGIEIESVGDYTVLSVSGNYVTSDMLDDYYTKSEVDDEIGYIQDEFADTSAWALNTFQPASAMSDYATTADLDDKVDLTAYNARVQELQDEITSAHNRIDELEEIISAYSARWVLLQ